MMRCAVFFLLLLSVACAKNPYRCKVDRDDSTKCEDGRAIVEQPERCEYSLDPNDVGNTLSHLVNMELLVDECEKHSDCSGPQPRCSYAPRDDGDCGYFVGRFCDPGCTTNADCGQDQLCNCADGYGVCIDVHPKYGCKNGADCPDDDKCLSNEYGLSFLCERPDDECVDAGDCSGEENCIFPDNGSHRRCAYVGDACIFD